MRKYWTPEEEIIVRKNIGKLPASEIGKLIGRTRSSVNAKIDRMMRNGLNAQVYSNSKLTDADVDMIRELHEEHGLSIHAIARKFDTNYKNVWNYVNYKVR